MKIKTKKINAITWETEILCESLDRDPIINEGEMYGIYLGGQKIELLDLNSKTTGKRITGYDLKVVFDFLAKNPKITELDLSDNHITALGLQSIAKFISYNPPLISLDLSKNDLETVCYSEFGETVPTMDDTGLFALSHAMKTNFNLLNIKGIPKEYENLFFPYLIRNHRLLINTVLLALSNVKIPLEVIKSCIIPHIVSPEQLSFKHTDNLRSSRSIERQHSDRGEMLRLIVQEKQFQASYRQAPFGLFFFESPIPKINFLNSISEAILEDLRNEQPNNLQLGKTIRKKISDYQNQPAINSGFRFFRKRATPDLVSIKQIEEIMSPKNSSSKNIPSDEVQDSFENEIRLWSNLSL